MDCLQLDTLPSSNLSYIMRLSHLILFQSHYPKMRLTDREAGAYIRENFEPITCTAHSIVYTEKGNSISVLKTAGYWIDG